MFNQLGSRAGLKAIFDHANRWLRPQRVRKRAAVNNVAPDFSDCQVWTVDVNGSTFTFPNPSKPPPTRVDEATYIAIIVKFSTANSFALGSQFKTTGYTASTSGYDHLLFLYDPVQGTYGLAGVRNAIFS